MDDSLSDMELPADLNAERAVLGAISLNSALLEQARALLDTSDFYLDSHRRIFDAMASLKESNNPIDTVTLPALLAQRNELDRVGGITYLASIIDGVPQTDDISYYCRIIKYKAKEREAIHLFNESAIRLVEGEEDLEAILERVQWKLATLVEVGNEAHALTGVYPSLKDFFNATFEEPEPILFGLHRGEVANLSAITNYGKTTLLFNTALSVAAGEPLWPLAPFVPTPRRVLYLDSESPATRARADLLTMIRGVSNSEAAKDNFIIVVDAAINGTPLNLSKPEHFKRVSALARQHRADLVVIDTAASTFELVDENNNAEVTRRAMNPMKRLAREGNCAVIFTHHIGKATETQNSEGAYRGRGASAFGALSRTVFTLERDQKKGPEYIVLNCAKVKGQSFQPVLLRLNPDTRWFEVCDAKPELRPEPLTAQDIAKFIREVTEARTEDIKRHFAGRGSARTIAQRIADAERLGLIAKANQKAPWRLCKGDVDLSDESAEVATASTDAGFVQYANPIRDCTNAQTQPDSASFTDLTTCPSCGTKGLLYSHCDRCGEFLR